MAKTKWVLLFATFLLSCISLAVFTVSFATSYWVTAEASSVNSATQATRNSEISYGLFSGTLIRQPLVTVFYVELTMTCLFDENACAYSCQKEVDARYNELRHIIRNETLDPCPVRTTRSLQSPQSADVSNSTLREARQSEVIPIDNFIGAGIWITTLIFLSIAMLFGLISAIFSIINVTLNPIETILSVPGLYIWNGVTIGATVITMILYGSLFASSIRHNVAITDTLTTGLSAYQSEGMASLGFSYWILFVPIVLHASNIGLLKYRDHVINQEPPPTTITVEKNDSTILLY